MILKTKMLAITDWNQNVELGAVEGSGSSIFVETIVISVGSCCSDVECDNSIGKGITSACSIFSLQVVHESVYKSVSKRLFNLHKKGKRKSSKKEGNGEVQEVR
jgi:hypothetical protein